jgi:hypothetical protein
VICLELFTSRLLDAERLLSEGPLDGSVADGQRFGDRLDLLVNRPEEAKRIITERWRRASTWRNPAPIHARWRMSSSRHCDNSARKSTPCLFLTCASSKMPSDKDPGAMVGKNWEDSLSLVGQSVRDRGVGGSNPLAPTTFPAKH